MGINTEEAYWNERFNDEYRRNDFYYESVTWAQCRPSVIMKPKLYRDGNMWCALYGENIQDGICGFGTSPYKAMSNFDYEFEKDIE